jgi:hypothetical protein
VAINIINSTVARNHAMKGPAGCGLCAPGHSVSGGLDPDAQVTLANSILAGNTAQAGPNCSGAVSSDGHNLLGSDSLCSGFTGTGDLTKQDPLLGPLGDNGGPTFTMALGTGSPAIDGGDDVVCEAPPVKGIDQRGIVRPQGTHCDIGAFEAESG